jgi:hypothetical protein
MRIFMQDKLYSFVLQWQGSKNGCISYFRRHHIAYLCVLKQYSDLYFRFHEFMILNSTYVGDGEVGQIYKQIVRLTLKSQSVYLQYKDQSC